MVICGKDETEAILDKIAPDEACQRLAQESFEHWLTHRMDVEMDATPKQAFSKEQMEILSLAFEGVGAPGALERAIQRWGAGAHP